MEPGKNDKKDTYLMYTLQPFARNWEISISLLSHYMNLGN